MFSDYYKKRGLWGIKGVFKPDVQRNWGSKIREFRDWWRALWCSMDGNYTTISSKMQSLLWQSYFWDECNW